MLSPRAAFSLAYLPARRAAYEARCELIERNAATIDAHLKHAIEFSRQALSVESSIIQETDAKATAVATMAGITPHPDSVRPQLVTPLLQAAWKAGEIARRVAISVEVAAHIAYLRAAAPENPDLKAQAAERARDLVAASNELTSALEATGLPAVIANASSIAKMVKLTSNLEPTTAGGYRELNELQNDIYGFLEAKAQQLDTAPPTQPASPPTMVEKALFKRILAEPSNHSLRDDWAKLADERKDPRAGLVRLQRAGGDGAQQLIQSHPEWTAQLAALGATKIKFAAGFPDEIHIDAESFLTNGARLLAEAPIRRLHVRNAKGRVRDVVTSPLLATIEALDLDDQGVTDADVEALAASSHAARLTQLDLRFNPISAAGVDAIAASRYLKKLEVVSLDGNPADPVDRQEYYDETNYHFVPTEAGKALEAKYGRLRWLHRS